MNDAPLNEDSRKSQLLADIRERAESGRSIDSAELAASYPDLATQIPEILATADRAAQSRPATATGSWSTHSMPMPERFARYRILRRIGSGGMGAVYEAEDPELSRQVAVKVPFLDHNPGHAESLARFLREARAAAGVHHQYVCSIFDVGEQHGVPFAVMALIRGGSLANRMSAGEFREPERAVSLTAQVAEGLAAIHARGIIHRDLKPANILLDDGGPGEPSTPKISDFGLARPSSTEIGLTRTGDVLGTPAYMAPEQAGGETDRIGPAVDIYALGVVLYQMLTGRLPFEGSALAVLAKVREAAPPPLTELRPELDSRLVAIVERAMAKQPDERYPSARAFADELYRWLNNKSQPAQVIAVPISKRRTAWLFAAIIASLAIVGAVLFTIWSAFHGAETPLSTRATAPSVQSNNADVVPDVGNPPKVQIQWEKNEDGHPRMVELPFVIAVIANLGGSPDDTAKRFRDRRLITINKNNLDQVFEQIAPRLVFSVPDAEHGGRKMLDVNLTFTRMADFSPDAVVARVPAFKQMLVGRNPEPSAERTDLDKRLSVRLTPVLHHPEFRRLEATWRGLNYLVAMVEADERLQIRVLNATKQEIGKDLEKAPEFDQSTLYKKLHVETFGILGGHPAGLIVGDFEINIAQPADVEILRNLSQVAAAAHCPLIASTGYRSFSLDSMMELGTPRVLAKVFSGTDYEAWRRFRATPEARFVALALPRILVRLPYGNDSKPTESFDFEEPFDLENMAVWMNSAWAHAVCVGQAVGRHGWPARICGRDGGGRVGAIPECSARSKDGDMVPLGPVDVTITLPREQELSALGFLPVLPTRVRNIVVFPNAASCAHGESPDSATRLNVLLCAARFSHSIRAMLRDRAAAAIGPRDVEQLNRWLAGYVTPGDGAKPVAEAAQFPLREGRVEALPIVNNPNQMELVAIIRPHFQLTDVATPVRLTIGRYAWNREQ